MASNLRPYRVAHLVLGVISVEMGIHSAIEDEGGGLVSLCVHGGTTHETSSPSKIKRRDYCPLCDNDTKASFRKGKEVSGGVVMLPAEALEELAEADKAKRKRMELTVHPAADLVGALPSGKSYYLAPREGAENNYALVAQMMSESPDLAFVGEFAFNGAAMLYQVVISDGKLEMRQLARPDLVRARPEAGEGLVNAQYLTMAKAWAELMCAPFDPNEYRALRAAALARLAEAGEAIAVAESAAPAAAVGDFGDALAAALKAAKAAKAKTAKPRRRSKPEAA